MRLQKRLMFLNRLHYLLLFLFPTLCAAQGISKGYHGSIEAGYSVNPSAPTISVNWSEINTIHGYQVNSNFFVGAGVGFHFLEDTKTSEIDGYPHWKRESSTEIPLFADFKWTILNKKVTPFIDLRLGHYLTNNSGVYESAGIGCSFALKHNQAIYALASYSVTKFRFQESYMYNVGKYDYKWAYKDFDESQNVVSVKLGYEF